MKEPAEITIIETRYTESGGRSLGQAFDGWLERWSCGERDRETALHLLFLAWYSCSEPTFLTGLPNDLRVSDLFQEVFDALGGEQSHDAEFLYVAGLMADLFPWCVGSELEWKARAQRCLDRSRQLLPTPLSPSVFADRGAYGQYFAHQVRQSARKA